MKINNTYTAFPFSIKNSLGLILLYSPVIPVLFFSPLLIAKLFGYSLAQQIGVTTSNFIALVLLSQVVAAVILYLIVARRLKAKKVPWSSLGLRKFNAWRALAYIAGWPLVIVAAGIMITIVTSLAGIAPPDNSSAASGILYSSNVLLGLVLAALFAPLIEEILFRGMLFSAFSARYGYGYGIVLSSLVFAVIHLNPLQMLTGIILGPYLCWMYKRLNSIYPGMVLHALHNATVTILFFMR